MKQKLVRFMYGRYGVDKLSKHLVWAGLVMGVVSVFFGGGLLYICSMVLFIYSYFRIFSKNTAKRYGELCRYERFLAKWKNAPAKWKKEAALRKEYKIFKCPSCRQKIRIPKGHGMVEIRCRKCQAVFRKRT